MTGTSCVPIEFPCAPGWTPCTSDEIPIVTTTTTTTTTFSSGADDAFSSGANGAFPPSSSAVVSRTLDREDDVIVATGGNSDFDDVDDLDDDSSCADSWVESDEQIDDDDDDSYEEIVRGEDGRMRSRVNPLKGGFTKVDRPAMLDEFNDDVRCFWKHPDASFDLHVRNIVVECRQTFNELYHMVEYLLDCVPYVQKPNTRKPSAGSSVATAEPHFATEPMPVSDQTLGFELRPASESRSVPEPHSAPKLHPTPELRPTVEPRFAPESQSVSESRPTTEPGSTTEPRSMVDDPPFSIANDEERSVGEIRETIVDDDAISEIATRLSEFVLDGPNRGTFAPSKPEATAISSPSSGARTVSKGGRTEKEETRTRGENGMDEDETPGSVRDVSPRFPDEFDGVGRIKRRAVGSSTAFTKRAAVESTCFAGSISSLGMPSKADSNARQKIERKKTEILSQLGRREVSVLDANEILGLARAIYESTGIMERMVAENAPRLDVLK